MIHKDEQISIYNRYKNKRYIIDSSVITKLDIYSYNSYNEITYIKWVQLYSIYNYMKVKNNRYKYIDSKAKHATLKPYNIYNISLQIVKRRYIDLKQSDGL